MKDSFLIVVGGAGRNVGKTEFVCRLIRRFSADHEIFGLKVSAIFPDERIYHGNHGLDQSDSTLFEEVDSTTRKDTSRMLRAGASRVFYLQSEETCVLEGYKKFRSSIPEGAIVVCESNSLGQILEPGLRVMVKSVSGEIKPRAVSQLERADLVVVSDGVSGFMELERISLSDEKGWLST